ncbi:MAG: UMP kinase [Candidatus Nanoarchaeia archaeon]|nr:UMP kinase [Candidatus Nanoarchaeia archaeon]
MAKPIVLSVGGSIFNPNEFNYSFISNLKKTLSKLAKERKIIVVIGGGKTARNYITPLRKKGLKENKSSLIGIAVTRLNARLFAMFFGDIASQHVAGDMKEVKNLLLKNKIVFCGGLRFVPDNTSDGTAAALANYFGCEFINMTNVKGLYTKDPKKFKDAKFISKISFKEFDRVVSSLKYEAGQHFVLDQHASKIIKKYKIKTYIIGPNLKNLENLINGNKFTGTIIW